jgi:hypothetical protein
VSLQWKSMPALVTARVDHSCCAVGGSVAVIGGETFDGIGGVATETASVEVLSSEEGAMLVSHPPLSCGSFYGGVAIAVEVSDSTAGQVLLLGGLARPLTLPARKGAAGGSSYRRVHTTAPSPPLAIVSSGGTAARRSCLVFYVGGFRTGSSAEIWGPSGQGAQDAAWTWTKLPTMSTARYRCSGCVLSDGRFAVLGRGECTGDEQGDVSSCEALTLDDNTHWEPLPPMHDARRNFVCAAMAGWE